MASQGPNSPGTAVSVNDSTGYDPNGWSSPNNIFTENATTSDTNNIGQQNYDGSDNLKATNFGFSIPSGATIDGIIVEVKKKASSSSPLNNIQDEKVYLVKANAVVGSNKADTVTYWPTTLTYATYGTSSDLWGTTWTDSQINASDFGVSLTADIYGNGKYTPIGYIDHIRITVYYTSGGGGPTSASALLLAQT